MTVMNNEDPALPDELPRDEEMHLLRLEVMNLSNKVQEYHKGNTTLMNALLRLADQHNDSNVGNARKVLKLAGVMFEDDGANWRALEHRKANPMTWEDAVRMFVKQPAERDRILALAELKD